MTEKKEDHSHKKHKVTHHSSKKVKKSSLWKIVSGVLFILILIVYFTGGSANTESGEVMGAEEAGEKAVSFINSNLLQQGNTAELKDIEETSNLYRIKLQVGDQEFDSYVTKDGSLLFPSSVDLTQEINTGNSQTQAAQTEVTKSDKPKAELYIFSYCPAGSSTLDSFAEAGKLLKNDADINVKFFSHMHGEYEKQQNMIQACIQDIAPTKYWDYAVDFYETVYSECASKRDVDCDMESSVELMNEKGINSDKVLKCVENRGEDIYANDKADATALQLRYSPSVVINDAYLRNADRSPEGLKKLICDSFNEAPDICSESLGSATTQSSGSC